MENNIKYLCEELKENHPNFIAIRDWANDAAIDFAAMKTQRDELAAALRELRAFACDLAATAADCAEQMDKNSNPDEADRLDPYGWRDKANRMNDLAVAALDKMKEPPQ
jgi:hypothetical protein